MADWEARGRRVQTAGKAVQRAGTKLTLLVTLPVLGFVFFGFLGLVVALVLAILLGAAMLVPDPPKE